MATSHDGNFDVKTTSSEVIRICHRIRGFLRGSLVLKIKPKTGQTLPTVWNQLMIEFGGAYTSGT